MREPLPELIAQLEQDSRFKGKLIADIPELAAFRLKFRRRAYFVANGAIGLTIFNFILATVPGYFLWWLSALAAGLTGWVVWRMESLARIMSRQLNRPAAEQVARDMLEIWD